MLQRILGRDVRLVTAGHAIAATAQRILEARELEAEGDERGRPTASSAPATRPRFRELGTRFLQMPLGEVERVELLTERRLATATTLGRWRVDPRTGPGGHPRRR